MQGIIKEAQSILEEDAEPEVLDAALIAAAQKVEHYEIASYGTACTFAEMLGDTESLKLLQQTLAEEKGTDEALSVLAESSINKKAMAGQKN
jgi:ferritin-like metal-binding protein YciE